MYEFDLGDGILTPLLAQELRQVHRTRGDMILAALEEFFPEGPAHLDCLDVACNEGYFSFLLHAKGARVKGIDVRPLNIERARAVQRIQGQDPERLTFAVEDFLANQDPPDRYHLTLFLGLLYHLENPMGALRILHRITRRLCVVETQLTRQQAPLVSGWGETGKFLQLPAALAIYREPDVEENRLAAHRGLSFIPNAAAVREMLCAAGFSRVEPAPPPADANPQYLAGDRAVFLAFK
jgi:SAM-dependent methyltransferase